MWQIYCCIRGTCVKREKKGAIYIYHLEWKCCIIHFMSLLKQNRSLFIFYIIIEKMETMATPRLQIRAESGGQKKKKKGIIRIEQIFFSAN